MKRFLFDVEILAQVEIGAEDEAAARALLATTEAVRVTLHLGDGGEMLAKVDPKVDVPFVRLMAVDGKFVENGATRGLDGISEGGV